MKYILFILVSLMICGCCIYKRTQNTNNGRMTEIGIASIKSADQAIKNIEE